VSTFGPPDPPTATPRALRRLSHSPVVPTTYVSRNVELDASRAESEAAVRQGYDDGYADGLARAAEVAEQMRKEEAQQAAAALAALGRAIDVAEEAATQMRAEIQTAAPKLAFALLEVLLGRELALSADPGQEAISKVLALDEGMQPATVRLHPDDVARLGAVALGRVVTIVADPLVESGGALVEIGRTTLDGQLGPALERVRRVLLGPSDPRTRDDRAA
jgi:flagellar assembly protein FliH